MFALLVKILEIVFKPLFDTSKEAILKSSEPKRKMTRSLIKLYDELEVIEYLSELLLKDAEEYIRKDWAAKTVARSKRRELITSSKSLKEATISLGESLSELYSMFSIHQRELLAPLIGIYNVKGMNINGSMGTPEVIDISNDLEAGALRLLQPKSDITEGEIIAECNDALIRRFRFEKKMWTNYLIEIDIDRNKEQVAEIIQRSRPILVQIGYTKGMLKEFIQKNILIEDFFK
jgi:hypothetical protein